MIYKCNISCKIFLCVFTYILSQLRTVVESGVNPFFHPNCHHQVVFARFNFEIYFPQLYLREANTDLIKQTINNFN